VHRGVEATGGVDVASRTGIVGAQAASAAMPRPDARADHALPTVMGS
jgi:hypothetical protein